MFLDKAIMVAGKHGVASLMVQNSYSKVIAVITKLSHLLLNKNERTHTYKCTRKHLDSHTQTCRFQADMPKPIHFMWNCFFNVIWI